MPATRVQANRAGLAGAARPIHPLEPSSRWDRGEPAETYPTGF